MSSTRLVRGIAAILLATLALGCGKEASDGADEFGPDAMRPKGIQKMRDKQLKDRNDAPPPSKM